MRTDYSTLIEHSLQAKKFSYSPYSKFSVGAAVLTTGNKIYTGTNIECASYSLCICAERVAFSKAVSEGEKKFKAIAISTSRKSYISPCGACRQFMSEFGINIDIILVKSKNEFKIRKLSELIPEVFSGSSLK